MALAEKTRNIRTDDESGIKFNPFRLLGIGEIMLRYCDGVRIKDFLFFAIITSDRLIFLESSRQNEGAIAKEIPISVIQKAVMERDEKDRPSLVISMKVGEQTRILRMVFTGLISEPETECREWFIAINGVPPDNVEIPSSPILVSPEKQVPAAPVVEQFIEKPEVIRPDEKISEEATVLKSAEVTSPEPVAAQKVTQVKPATIKKQEPVRQKKRTKKERQVKSVNSEDSVQIYIEKPSLTPISLTRKISTPAGVIKGKSRFCLHCGAKIPAHARFCSVCGKSQN